LHPHSLRPPSATLCRTCYRGTSQWSWGWNEPQCDHWLLRCTGC
jgi:hypothetical protein